MINLLVKDLLLLKKSIWLPFVYSSMIVFFFSKTDSAAQTIYIMGINMISYILIMYSTAYDDLNKSDIMLNSLPINRKDIVSERYLSIFVFILASSIIMAFTGVIMTLLGIGGNIRIIKLSDIGMAATSLSIIVFLYLPVYFKLGYLKAKLVNFLVFFAVFFLPTLLARLLAKNTSIAFLRSLNQLTEMQLVLIMLTFAGVLGLISYVLSLSFYRKREF